MKVVVFIFCLFMSVNVFGQTKSGVKKKANPLIVVDGVVLGRGQLNKVNPNDIDNVTILKGAAAMRLYGINAADGALLIMTKNYKKMHPRLSFAMLEHALAATAPSAKALLVIDGAVYSGDIASIDSNKVLGIDFIQSSKAIILYGVAGANGAIDLKMKPNLGLDTIKKTTN